MLLLKAQKLIKTFGARTLFTIDRLEVHDHDRIGLVGANGAGKSTLLGILYGEEPYDEGLIERRCPIALIRQSGEPEGESGRRMQKELALMDSPRMSGGERTRAAIAAALSQEAPLLFADEPTTNLDLDGISVFREKLENYFGAMLLISHDRALLDSLCTSIWEIADGGLRVFPGNYTDWTVQKQRERDFAQFEYEQYRSEKTRLQAEAAVLREQARTMRKAPKRMGNSEARLHKGSRTVPQGQVAHRAAVLASRAGHLEEKERPSDPPEIRMALGAASPVTSKNAARIEGLTIRYGKRTVLDDVSFSITTGKRTVMFGPNGAGKTTAIEYLLHNRDRAQFAQGIKAGYFAQDHTVLDLQKNVLENVRETSSLPEHEVRTILANLMIAKDDVYKPAGVLSGGERAKVSFARLLASDCNLLVLDEPTNHIDLFTAEALEKLLVCWQGTMLLITHDQRLIEKLAERLLFVQDGKIETFEGGWDAWQAEQTRRAAPRDDMSDLREQLRRLGELY